MDEGIRLESGQTGNGTWVRIPASPLHARMMAIWQTWFSQKESFAGSTPAPGTLAGYPANKRHVAQWQTHQTQTLAGNPECGFKYQLKVYPDMSII